MQYGPVIKKMNSDWLKVQQIIKSEHDIKFAHII
jgi:hypothetical protein